MIRVAPARQTSFGSMLYYPQDNKVKRMEFATDEEANEFAEMLKNEQEKLENNKNKQ